MSGDLAKQLDEARAVVARLERVAAAATCVELGKHDWQSIGGCNAGCEEGKYCSCSVPVYVCSRCGDCDYGDNREAVEIRRRCADVVDASTIREAEEAS
jgi:hypothetical protein